MNRDLLVYLMKMTHEKEFPIIYEKGVITLSNACDNPFLIRIFLFSNNLYYNSFSFSYILSNMIPSISFHIILYIFLVDI